MAGSSCWSETCELEGGREESEPVNGSELTSGAACARMRAMIASSSWASCDGGLPERALESSSSSSSSESES